MTILTFSCERLSERRASVMGVAALMIYFAHVYAYADLGIINRFFSYGNWGVDVFLLMSGFGMCHSMAEHPAAGVFYWKRFVRVGVPYLVLAIPFCFASDVLIAQAVDWGLFALDVSTLSYWLFHRGAWYVAMLVPLYLSVPFIGRLVRGYGAPVICIAASVLSFIIASVLRGFFPDPGFAGNVANVAQRLSSFFAGWLLADRMISGRTLKGGGAYLERDTTQRDRHVCVVPLQEHGVYEFSSRDGYRLLGGRSDIASIRPVYRDAR